MKEEITIRKEVKDYLRDNNIENPTYGELMFLNKYIGEDRKIG